MKHCINEVFRLQMRQHLARRVYQLTVDLYTWIMASGVGLSGAIRVGHTMAADFPADGRRRSTDRGRDLVD
jgi:hypothetical protein